jgi:GTP-binding protein HflX
MKKALIVGGFLQHAEHIPYVMEELKNLAEAAYLEVLEQETQMLKSPNPRYYIGDGKVNELKALVAAYDIDVVVFHNELSGSQLRNLEETLDTFVMDRTMLILDIFASRAKSKEAMTQVEIAQLEYLKPRLMQIKGQLNRQQGGIGSRGPGEKKLELDRRKIDHDIQRLKTDLDHTKQTRELQRKKRVQSSLKKVGLVGYTNAGKSTILNNILKRTDSSEDKMVYEKDMLFATLDTSTRHIEIDKQKPFLLTDTVGFVSNLPHNLVESFLSTLEEITYMDLLVHVIDASSPFLEEQLETTNKTLAAIGVKDIPILYVYNKIDKLDEPIHMSSYPNIELCALDPIDIQSLLEQISTMLFKEDEDVEMLIPYADGDVVSFLNDHAVIRKQTHIEEGTLLSTSLSPELVKKYAKYIKTINKD